MHYALVESHQRLAGSPLDGKILKRKNFRQSHWLIELSPRKNFEALIVGIRSTFRGSTFFRLVEIQLNGDIIDADKSLSRESRIVSSCRVFQRKCNPIITENLTKMIRP